MSKKKKTIEELLEEALVQEEEHPYEVPRNWEWVKMGSVITLISGRDVSTKLCNSEEKGIPYIMGASNIVDNELDVERWIETPAVIGVRGDILISVKGTVGKVVIQELDEVHLSRQIMALRSKDTVLNKFLYLYIQTYIEKLKEAAKGIIPGISRDDILNAPFPLLPLNEQKRIAEKVERLLSKIDEAKQLIEEAKGTFELRRAAILDKAFRGEYTSGLHYNKSELTINKSKGSVKDDGKTEEFKNNLINFVPEHWEIHCLTDILEEEREICYGIVQTGEDTENGVPTVRAGDLKEEEINLGMLKRVAPDIEEKYPRSKLKGSEVLISIRGSVGYIGTTTDKMIGLNISREVAIIPVNETVYQRYLKYYLQSPLIQSFFRKIIKGVAQRGINLNQLRVLPVAIPSLDEQKYIVEKIDFLLETEQQAINNLKIESLISNLEKSILSKAFRGELGTNDPSEENAIELLKEVLQEQVK
ncbi:MAG: restriction endonuclease subunit S [Bacillota bacterium]